VETGREIEKVTHTREGMGKGAPYFFFQRRKLSSLLEMGRGSAKDPSKYARRSHTNGTRVCFFCQCVHVCT
jgi:hypothetical protein